MTNNIEISLLGVILLVIDNTNCGGMVSNVTVLCQKEVVAAVEPTVTVYEIQCQLSLRLGLTISNRNSRFS